MKKIFFINLLILIFISEANAYIGLGPLIPIIGSSIAFVFGLIVVFLGFISYPLIKVYKFFKKKKEDKISKIKKENE